MKYSCNDDSFDLPGAIRERIGLKLAPFSPTQDIPNTPENVGVADWAHTVDTSAPFADKEKNMGSSAALTETHRFC